MCARMSAAVHLEQMSRVEMRIARGRAEFGVPEKGLDRDDVRAALEEMRRDRVPQDVGAAVLADGVLERLPDEAIDRPGA